MSQTDVTLVQEKTFDVIKSAVNQLVNFVKPTYGPAGNKVIISKVTHAIVVDDGVQIARDFELPDSAENAVVKVVREVAIKTNDRVGDGTTSSLIMLQAIINEVARLGKGDGQGISRELLKGLGEVKEQLTKSAKKITSKEDLKKVARVSFDDAKISEMIADLYFKMGADATITIDRSPTMDTSVETSDGLTIKNGYISPYMITNPERMETVIEKPYILFTDYRITEANDLLPLMNKLAEKNIRELVVIAENMEGTALATAVLNKVQGKFLTVAVVAPSDNRKVSLEDMALMTGAHMFTESKGDKLENAEVEHLGRAARFICRRTESVIVGPKGKKADVNAAISSLKESIANETDPSRKKEATMRLAAMTNKVAVIKVGAPTENEQRALKYKVEDAVNAVKAAYKNGVVCGAGLSLQRLHTSSSILNKALKYPHRQLLVNMGIDEEETLGPNEAYNVVTGRIGNFMDIGVVDPVDVLIAGVESAVSIASMLVTSSGIICEAPKKVETPTQ